MSAKRVTNPLALAVLSTVAEAPRHPYDIALVLRSRAKEQSIKINYGSLYTVVRNLERDGYLAALSTERDGRRPERTVYEITEDGKVELVDRLSEWLSTYEKEFPRFEAALAMMPNFHPDQARNLLADRLGELDAKLTASRKDFQEAAEFGIPRLLMIEHEYAIAMLAAEAEFVRALLTELEEGTFPGVDTWREIHETGEVPAELVELSARAMEAQAAKKSREARGNKPTT